MAQEQYDKVTVNTFKGRNKEDGKLKKRRCNLSNSIAAHLICH